MDQEPGENPAEAPVTPIDRQSTRVFEKLGPRKSIVLVGGQALSVYARMYNPPELAQCGPFVSADLDFQGGRLDVEWAAEQLGVEANVADVGGVSPNSGTITLIDEPTGEKIGIDFLHAVQGLDYQEVLQDCESVPVAEGVTIQVMHPFHCLRSRLANVATLPGGASEHGLTQLKVMIYSIRQMIKECDDPKVACEYAEAIFKLTQHRHAKQIYRRHGIDVFNAVPNCDMPAKFLSERYPRLMDYLAKERQRWLRSRTSHASKPY